VNESQYRSVINRLGFPGTFEKVKPPHTRINIARIGQRALRPDDALVNSYGVGARIVTIAAADLPGVVPEKFDAVRIGDERIVFEHVEPAHEPGSGKVIGWRCYVKGK
jgi:limonene-1,2-epoxide hydrolase